MSNTRQIKVTAPVALIKEIDEQVEDGRFTGRGDFALYAIRFYIDSERRLCDKGCSLKVSDNHYLTIDK